MSDRRPSDPRPSASEPSGSDPGPPAPPTLGALFRANLKVVGVALLLAVACYGVWRGLAWLFPDWGWLQPKG